MQETLYNDDQNQTISKQSDIAVAINAKKNINFDPEARHRK